MALIETTLVRGTAFVRNKPSEDDLLSFELIGQNVRQLPNYYLVVALHAQALQAIVQKIQDDLFPSRFPGRSAGLGFFERSFASPSTVEFERLPSGLAFEVEILVYWQWARAGQALPGAKLFDPLDMYR